MSETESTDKRDLSILVVVLAGVMALGVVAAGIGAWTMLGQPRVAKQAEILEELGAAARLPDILVVFVDGLRADVLDDADRACPTLLALAAAGESTSGHVVPSTATAATLASFLVTAEFSNQPLGLRSPREIGFHRLPESIPTRAEAWRSAGRATRAVIGAPGLLGDRSGLARGFDSWSASESARDMQAVFDEASALPAATRATATVLQFALDDEPDPGRLVALCRERLDRFGDERGALEAVLNKSLESEARTSLAITKLFGRRRGQAAWAVWRKARYDVLVAEFDERLHAYLESFERPPVVLVAGTRGRAVGEPRPDELQEGFADAMIRVPLVMRAPMNSGETGNRGEAIAVPRAATKIHSPALGAARSVADLATPLSFSLTVDLRSSAGSNVEVREVADPRNRAVLAGTEASTLTLADPRAAIRVEFADWNTGMLTEVGVGASTSGSLTALGAVAWPWIADERAPEWGESPEPLLDVVRQRSSWELRLSASARGPAAIYLASYPLEREAAPLDPVGARAVLTALPGACVIVLQPGQSASLKLENGKRLALRARGLEGSPIGPQDVRYLGRQLFGTSGQFLVPAWWPARADWFVRDLNPDESRPSGDFSKRLVLQRPDLGPALTGPLGLTLQDASALLALPSDA